MKEFSFPNSSPAIAERRWVVLMVRVIGVQAAAYSLILGLLCFFWNDRTRVSLAL